jgi:hypothetical protein
MTPDTFALLERMHGHAAVLGLAVLLHPVVTLRRRKALTLWSVRTADLGALLIAMPWVAGWWLYPTYRLDVKPGLWAEHRQIALLFETKEHLAALTLFLVVSGAITLRAAGNTASGRRTAWTLLACAWVAGAMTGGLGVFVSSF